VMLGGEPPVVRVSPSDFAHSVTLA
jgi:hypothetical protein